MTMQEIYENTEKWVREMEEQAEEDEDDNN